MANGFFVCVHCLTLGVKEVGHINRARRDGRLLFCGSACFGAHRRVERSDEECRAMKADYDRRRRADLHDEISKAKRDAYQRALAADPVGFRAAQRAWRQRPDVKARHRNYCRRPEYVRWKAEYDRALRALEYGEFADAHVALVKLQAEVDARADFDEKQRQKGTLNKSQQRRRALESLERFASQKRLVGDARRNQERKNSAGGR